MMTTTTPTTTTPTSMLEELREGLAHLKDLETELSAAAQRDDDVESSATTHNTLMVERYQQSRDLYLQRRMENLVVDHVGTYDETTETFDFPPQVSEEEDVELNERHTQALATLQTSAQRIQTQMSQLRDTKDAVSSRRRELEQMMHDYLNGNKDDDDNNADETTDDAAAAPVADVDEDEMAMEQERIEQLQQTKRRLQDKLAKMQQETRQAQEHIRHNKEETALLQQQQQHEKDGDGEEEAQDFSSKVEELREMKVFYDSLREVLEELGGVKILNVHEQASDRHLLLTVLLYDEFEVQIELQVYRTTFLKLVHAKWLSKPVVVVHPSAAADAEQVVSPPPQDGSSFSLTMESLDDLVQVAKTTLGPPHDVRFIIRETLARIRVHQARVDDLALLRRHVLTKVHNNSNNGSGSGNTTTQVVCSLNDGIVIVMRLYEQYVRVEQIVGVSGWTEATTDQIQAALQQQDETETDTTTPTTTTTCSSIVRRVQAEIESFKKRGVADYPKGTPTMPKKQRKEGSNELDE